MTMPQMSSFGGGGKSAPRPPSLPLVHSQEWENNLRQRENALERRVRASRRIAKAAEDKVWLNVGGTAQGMVADCGYLPESSGSCNPTI